MLIMLINTAIIFYLRSKTKIFDNFDEVARQMSVVKGIGFKAYLAVAIAKYIFMDTHSLNFRLKLTVILSILYL